MSTENIAITEDYVSFETAKLLKEKGFDIPCNTYFVEVEKETAKSKFKRKFYHSSVAANRNAYKSEMANHYYFSCPTLQMAMKWLREKKGIAVIPVLSSVLDNEKFLWDIKIVVAKTNDSYSQGWVYETQESACEAAIKYCLEDLI